MSGTDSVTRLVVMASGNGSNLQAVLDACASGALSAQVAAVVSDRRDAFALQRAETAGVPGVHVGLRDGETRASYDARLADVVSGFDPDIVVLAGWMRLLTLDFLGWFPGMVVNLHPALPGELPGTHAIARAHAECQAGTRTRSGVMVHLVPDEGVDDGPVLAAEEIELHPGESLSDLEVRVHAVEHRLLVSTLRDLCLRRPTLPLEGARP